MQQIAQINFKALDSQVPGRFNSSSLLTDIFAGPMGLISLFLFFGGGLLLLYLLMGGLKLMLSGGDPKKIAGAQQTITNALIGMLVIMFAYFIIRAFGIIFGLQGITGVFI